MKKQKEKILSILAERLQSYGFERKEYDTLVRTIDERTIQNITFSTSYTPEGVFYLLPSVGIIYRDVARLMRELGEYSSSEYPDYAGIMIGLNIGYPATKRMMEWEFTKAGSVEEGVNDMVDTIIRYGIPYMDSMIDRRQMCYDVEAGKDCPLQEYILPLLYHLEGNDTRALECLKEYLKQKHAYVEAKIQEQTDCYLPIELTAEEREAYYQPYNEYLTFIDKFKRMLEK